MWYFWDLFATLDKSHFIIYLISSVSLQVPRPKQSRTSFPSWNLSIKMRWSAILRCLSTNQNCQTWKLLWYERVSRPSLLLVSSCVTMLWLSRGWVYEIFRLYLRVKKLCKSVVDFDVLLPSTSIKTDEYLLVHRQQLSEITCLSKISCIQCIWTTGRIRYYKVFTADRIIKWLKIPNNLRYFFHSWNCIISCSLVLIFQNEAGRIQLEGCLGSDYFKVRELLYDQYAIVWEQITGTLERQCI